jgi:uncharacterized membrane protein
VVILKEPESNATSSEWDGVVIPSPAEENVYILATALGDFDPTHDADEIVSVGYLGKVIKTQYEYEDFNLNAVQTTQVVNAGKGTEFQFIITPRGGFEDDVKFELLGDSLPSGIEAEFAQVQITPPGMATLTVSTSISATEGSYELTVKCTNLNASLSHAVNLTLTVEPTSTPDFVITAKPESQSVVADFSTVYIVDLEPINDYNVPVKLSVSRLPTGVSAQFNHTSIVPPGSANLTLQTSTITPNWTYYIPIKASDAQNLEHSIVIKLVVGATGNQDFMLAATTTTQTGIINQTVSYNIEVISLFGFKSLVNLDVKDLPVGVNAKFYPSAVFPTANVTLELTLTETAPEGQYDLKIEGYYSNIRHSIIVKLIVIYQAPEFELSVVPQDAIINVTETAEFNVNIIPNKAFRETVTLTIDGLPDDIYWNEDITPVYVETTTGLILKFQTRITTQLGKYNLTFTIRSESGLEHNTTVELEIIPPDDTSEDEAGQDLTIFYYGAILMVLMAIWIAGYFRYKKKREDK